MTTGMRDLARSAWHHDGVTRPSRAAGALLVPVLLVLLGACGGTDDNAAGVGPDPATNVPTSASSSPTTTPGLEIDGKTSTPTPDVDGTEAPAPDQPTRTETPSLPPVDIDGAPSTYDEGLAKLKAAPGDRVRLSRFFTPSGNLYCVVRSPDLPSGCELGEGGIEDPDYCGADGATTFVGRIEMPDGIPMPVCNTDTIREPGGGTLAYGDVAVDARSSVQCLSEEIGVTCLDRTTEQGFFLARGTYALLS